VPPPRDPSAHRLRSRASDARLPDVEFPRFLSPAFDEQALAALGTSVVVVNADGFILWVNDGWARFAEAHGGPVLPIGSSYFDGISAEIRPLYESVIAEALTSGAPREHEYVCPTPDGDRRFRLRILPIDRQALVLEHSPVVADALPRASSLVRQCSDCRRVHEPTTNAWQWVAWEAAIPPRTTHVMCPTCAGFYWRRRLLRP